MATASFPKMLRDWQVIMNNKQHNLVKTTTTTTTTTNKQKHTHTATNKSVVCLQSSVLKTSF